MEIITIFQLENIKDYYSYFNDFIIINFNFESFNLAIIVLNLFIKLIIFHLYINC